MRGTSDAGSGLNRPSSPKYLHSTVNAEIIVEYISHSVVDSRVPTYLTKYFPMTFPRPFLDFP